MMAMIFLTILIPNITVCLILIESRIICHLHTNIASLGKHIDELMLTLSLLKNEFHIIAITEHKIRRGVNTIVNIDIPGYKPFIFDYTETRHGETGFYVKDSFQIKVRDDLKFNSPGNFESTFIELIFPNTKQFIIGCIYRHPSSSLSLNHFTSDYIEPLLDIISSEGKM